MAGILAIGLGLAACSGTEPSIRPPTASTTTTTGLAPPLGFSDADDGRSATIAVGQQLTVILHSSDFVFRNPSDPAVLRADGPPTVTPGGPSCVEGPGSGCGTVVATFVGLASGEVELRADRAACSEPECAPADAHWRLSVHVGEPSAAPTTTTTTATATTATADLESEVRGTVVFSPTCPVERVPPDPACAPRPGAATVELARLDGTVVARYPAGPDGIFNIRVAPGTYTVLASASLSGIGGGCQADPAEVTTGPGESTTITVTCDTGIR